MTGLCVAYPEPETTGSEGWEPQMPVCQADVHAQVTHACKKDEHLMPLSQARE